MPKGKGFTKLNLKLFSKLSKCSDGVALKYDNDFSLKVVFIYKA